LYSSQTKFRIKYTISNDLKHFLCKLIIIITTLNMCILTSFWFASDCQTLNRKTLKYRSRSLWGANAQNEHKHKYIGTIILCSVVVYSCVLCIKLWNVYSKQIKKNINRISLSIWRPVYIMLCLYIMIDVYYWFLKLERPRVEIWLYMV